MSRELILRSMAQKQKDYSDVLLVTIWKCTDYHPSRFPNSDLYLLIPMERRDFSHAVFFSVIKLSPMNLSQYFISFYTPSTPFPTLSPQPHKSGILFSHIPYTSGHRPASGIQNQRPYRCLTDFPAKTVVAVHRSLRTFQYPHGSRV